MKDRQSLNEIFKNNKEVIFYLVWICFFLIYSHLVLKYSFPELKSKKWTEISIKSKNISLYSSIVFLLMLFLYFNRIFTRQDGYYFLPGQSAYIVSKSSYYERYYKFIQIILFLLAWISAFGYIGSTKSSYVFWMSVAIIAFVIIILSMKRIEKNEYFVHSHNFFTISIFLIILKSVVDFSQNAYLTLLIFVAVIFLAIGLGSLIKNRSNLIKFLLTTATAWLLSEFLAADQSKKNAENISLINYLVKKINPNEEKSMEFIADLTGKYDKLFLKSYNPLHSNLESDFLHLKYKKDFDAFKEKVLHIDSLKEKYTDLLQKINTIYLNKENDFTEVLMDARTENIKKRNTNNLKVSLGILIISQVTTYFYYKDWAIHLTVYFLICLVFLRLLLRSFEIGRAFYIDFMYTTYPKSFLSGPDRVYLAIKSVIEVSFLSSSIYLLHQSLSKDWTFNILDIVRTIAYALSVSIFNISFPESPSFSQEKGLLFLLTHLVQVIISIVLITMSISSYMGRSKNINYFKFVIEENNFFILRVFKNHMGDPEVVLNVNSSLINSKQMPDDLRKEVQTALRDKKISRKEFDYILNLLNEKYF